MKCGNEYTPSKVGEKAREKKRVLLVLYACGHTWAVKNGLLLCMIPSFVPSLALTNSGCQSAGMRDVSMAKPWFCGEGDRESIRECNVVRA